MVDERAFLEGGLWVVGGLNTCSGTSVLARRMGSSERERVVRSGSCSDGSGQACTAPVTIVRRHPRRIGRAKDETRCAYVDVVHYCLL